MQVSQNFNKLNDLEFCIPVSIFPITCTSSSQKLDEVVFTVWQAIHGHVELRILLKVFFMTEVYLKLFCERTSSRKRSISVSLCKMLKILKMISCAT